MDDATVCYSTKHRFLPLNLRVAGIRAYSPAERNEIVGNPFVHWNMTAFSVWLAQVDRAGS